MTHLNDTLTTFLSILLSFFLDLFNTNLITLYWFHQVFYMDSLKFYLSLYGHKLPVMCIDISSDGELIVTGSQDKNLKIWGLDFGDCHKSIFAHGDRYFQNSYRISKNGIKSTQSCGLSFSRIIYLVIS